MLYEGSYGAGMTGLASEGYPSGWEGPRASAALPRKGPQSGPADLDSRNASLSQL